MNFDYQKICQELIKDLPERQKEIIFRRFDLAGSGLKRETLESIGRSFGITRERVRQIEKDGLERIKPKLKKYQRVFQDFENYLRRFGGFKKEEILFNVLGKGKWQNQIYFLLNLDNRFERLAEDEEFYSLWLVEKNSLNLAKKVIENLPQTLKKIGKPLSLKELSSFSKIKNQILASYLEISKKIQKNEENLYGLKDWPEINPRGIKDKAYLVFKKIGKPLHFTEVANLIKGSHLQTVHNELIKDDRFVLIGRGIYALVEWGYEPGQVKDIILKILKEEKNPLTKEEILERVKRQRMVKETTILLNLSNKNYFQRDSQGKYKINSVMEV